MAEEITEIPAAPETKGDPAVDVEAQEDTKLEPVDEAALDEEKGGLRKETWGVLILCLVMVGLYGVSMGVFSTLVVFIAGGVAIFVGATVAKHQYYDIESLDTLRTIHNRLRNDVNDFSEENTKLAANNDRLEEEIEPLKDCEKKLAEIAEKSGRDVNKLKGLVSENQTTLDKMHKIQKDDIVQSMMQLLMEVDKDEDGDLSDREAKRLVTKMKNLPAIDLNEDNLNKHLGEVRRVSYFLDVIHQITDDDLPDEERMFTIAETDPDELED